MGGDAGDTLQHLAGYGVGALSALTSLKGGGLQSWLLNRQRAIEDPAIRASLVGSPFASGMLFQSGSDAAAPGAMPAAGGTAEPGAAPAPGHAVAAPSDLAWLQQQNPARRFVPNAPPLPAEAQVQVQAAQGIVSGLQSADPVVRAQAKLVGKIPLTAQEQDAVVGRGKAIQAGLGPGGTVGVETPGMPITIGSPYSVAPGIGPDEFASYGEAAAAAAKRGGGWSVEQTSRGTFRPVQIAPPAAPATPTPYNPNAPAAPGQPAAPTPYNPNAAPAPAGPPARPPLAAAVGPPLFAGASTTTGGPPPTIPTRTNNPGDIQDGKFAQSQPGYVGPGPAKKDGGTVAVFDSPASGMNAMGNLLRGKAYAGLTVGAAASKWSNGGYGDKFVSGLGIDPSRTVASLTPDEMGTLTTGMARREGFKGPLGSGAPPAPRAAPVVAPAPATRPAPRPAPAPVVVAAAPPPRAAAPPGAPTVALAPPPPPYMGGPYDPNAPAPGSVPYQGRVGYPSAAFGAEAPAAPTAPVPEMAPGGEPAITTPTVPAVPVPKTQAPVVVEPTTGGMPPLSHVTVRGAGGTEYTYDYGAPSIFAENMRKAGITSLNTASPEQLQQLDRYNQESQARERATAADVERITRPATPGEAAGTATLQTMRNNLDSFFHDFPHPADRDKYVGWISRPMSEWLSYARQDPKFELFVHDLSGFQDFDSLKKDLAGYEQSDLGGIVPTGHERDHYGFEQKLFDFDLTLSHDLGLRLALQRMPVGQQTSAWVNDQRAAFQKERTARMTDDALRAMGIAPSDGAPQAAAPPPAPATAPPTTPPASAQGPVVFYGHSPAGY